MCFLYPQVYDDGCEVLSLTTTTTSSSKNTRAASLDGLGSFICVPCAHHAATHRRTREPCGLGKVVISACGPCPRHHNHHQGGEEEEERAEDYARGEHFSDSTTLFDARRDVGDDEASVWDLEREDYSSSSSSSSSSGASLKSPKVGSQERHIGWGQWARTSIGSWRNSRSGSEA